MATKKPSKIIAKNKAKIKIKSTAKSVKIIAVKKPAPTKKTMIKTKNKPSAKLPTKTKIKITPKIKKVTKPTKKSSIKTTKKSTTNTISKETPKTISKPEIKVETKVPAKIEIKSVAPAKKTPSKIKTKEFKSGDYAVYPSHGVGKILDIENIKVADQKFEVMTIHFEREKLTIKVPTAQIEKIGIRHLVTKKQMDQVFDILRSGVKKLKGMWSRRAQEYESKINSGDIILLSEVLRDLTRDIQDEERSYSERIIYETAIYRLASEYSAISGIDFEKARDEIVSTAKNKLNSSDEAKEIKPKDDFNEEFDGDEEEEEEEDEDGDEDMDDEDDED